MSPWDGSQVMVMPVGTVMLGFIEANGVFSHNLGSLAGMKPITRQVFSSPQTVCR